MHKNLKNIRLLLAAVAILLLAVACGGAEQGVVTVPEPAASNKGPDADSIKSVIAVQDSPTGDVQAQSVQIIGQVQKVEGATAQINGLTVNTANASADAPIVEGATVQVQGVEAPGGAIDAEYVWVLQPEPQPTPITATVSSGVPFVIEGAVQAINGNRVRIHGYDLELDDDPRLRAVQVGDVLRIGGEVDDGHLDMLFDDRIDDDLDDDRYVAVRQSQVGFLSNEVYVSDDGQRIWRDSGSCADAPPGWAGAGDWRARCSGEFGGGPPAAGSGASNSASIESGNSGASGASAPSGSININESSGSSSGSFTPPQPPPPPPPPPAGGNGDSSSGSFSSSGSSS